MTPLEYMEALRQRLSPAMFEALTTALRAARAQAQRPPTVDEIKRILEALEARVAQQQANEDEADEE